MKVAWRMVCGGEKLLETSWRLLPGIVQMKNCEDLNQSFGNGNRKKIVGVKDNLKVNRAHRVFNRVHGVVLGIYSAL